MCLRIIKTCPACGQDTTCNKVIACSAGYSGLCNTGSTVKETRLPIDFTDGEFFCHYATCTLHKANIDEMKRTVQRHIQNMKNPDGKNATPFQKGLGVSSKKRSSRVATAASDDGQGSVRGDSETEQDDDANESGDVVPTGKKRKAGVAGAPAGNKKAKVDAAPMDTQPSQPRETWTPEDIQKLVNLKDGKMSWKYIQSAFPGRSNNALHSKYSQYKKAQATGSNTTTPSKPSGTPTASSMPSGTPVAVPSKPSGTPIAVSSQPSGTPIAISSQPSGTPIAVSSQPSGTPIAISSQPSGTPIAVSSQPSGTPIAVSSQPSDTPIASFTTFGTPFASSTSNMTLDPTLSAKTGGAQSDVSVSVPNGPHGNYTDVYSGAGGVAHQYNLHYGAHGNSQAPYAALDQWNRSQDEFIYNIEAGLPPRGGHDLTETLEPDYPDIEDM